MRGRVALTSQPIDPAAVLRETGTADDGAVVLFLGTVRRQNEGREVVAMHYEAYAEMAEHVLGEIAREADTRWAPSSLSIVHRVGDLVVGDVSVAIAVSTPHRADAFDAARFVIEAIKHRLPVWKQETYATGEVAWLDGCVPTVTGPSP